MGIWSQDLSRQQQCSSDELPSICSPARVAAGIHRRVYPKLVEAPRRWLFDQHWLAAVTGRQRIVALGDSHVLVVPRAVRRHHRLRAVVSTVRVGGATAQGIVNPNSQTNALSRFEERLSRAKPWQHLVFMLGEVDCGFVIWYRAEKHGVPIDDQLELSIRNYIEFIDRQLARGFRRISVLSVPLPTIVDGQDWGEVANLRREVTTAQRERTQLTVQYNKRLQSACEKRGVVFLDVTSEQFDHRTGVIRADLRHPSERDHHLHPQRFAELVAEALRSIIQRDRSTPVS